MQVPNDLLTESLIDFISTIFGAEQAILPHAAQERDSWLQVAQQLDVLADFAPPHAPG